MRVLITGAAGFIGRRLGAHLAGSHELLLTDARGEPGGIVPVDVTSLPQVVRAAAGVDAIIHLAIASGHEGEFEDDAFNQERFRVNVEGTWHVLEAARRNGVSRVVLTSSLTVVWGYGPDEWVPPDAPARPVGTYALTKLLAEVTGREYARQFGITVPCLRIAKPVDVDDHAARALPVRPQWIAFPDLLRVYELALTAPLEGFEIFHVVGESSVRRWELTKARDLLGYTPTLRLEDAGFTLE